MDGGSPRKSKHWHRRQSSFSHIVDCSKPTIPEPDDLLKKRDGSVLARHTILKADRLFRESGLDEGVRLMGAPNFRKTDLSIYGVAQPNLSGLHTLLTLLSCGPFNPEGRSCTWFNTREEPLIFINDEPFVLREQANPLVNIKTYAGISRERLELMEERLKADIINEATLNGGVILIHDELGDGRIVPGLVGCDTVRTSQEVFQALNERGYHVDYRRVPMSHGLSPMDPFIDDYIDVFRKVPTEHSVVFSCGLGIGRTTFGMIVGLLIRRALTIEQTLVDPLQAEGERQDVLRLILVLEKALGNKDQSAIQWVMKRDQIIETLLSALTGNYKVILDLVRVLENGVQCKKTVDVAIDRCEYLLNLRESILIGRVRHSIQVPDSLETALAFLERYFTLIALCGYLNQNDTACQSFTCWIKARPEIWTMFEALRKDSYKLKKFLPIVRLTGLTKPKSLALTKEEAEAVNAETNVLNNRSGSVLVPHTILKMDLWSSQYKLPVDVDGAINFRKLSERNIYAMAQPRLQAVGTIIERLYADMDKDQRIVWINVREEPLVYIHNEPYVLRDKFKTFRNLRSYSGIPSERLEHMEARLRDDILVESTMYQNKVLVHAEDTDGEVYPVWQTIACPEEVKTTAQIFSELRAHQFPNLEYYRIPVTAEDAPEPADFDAILKIVASHPLDQQVFVFNCQIGAGRSTTGQVIAAQVISWLQKGAITSLSLKEKSTTDTVHFKEVHSILRAIRYGLESKHALDCIIDDAAAVVNLRTVISEWKEKAEHSADPIQSHKALRKGIGALKRYCLLLLFQAYLNDCTPAADLIEPTVLPMESFVRYIERHPEFVTLLQQLDDGHATLETLQADNQTIPDETTEGHALTSEVAFVISGRKGAVLGPMTILKYDHFPGCQKLSLPERIDGAPNFREVSFAATIEGVNLSVYGMAMPMAGAIKDVLARMHASSNGSRHVLWISLREEPVVFVNNRPFVLRVVKDPIANIEMTGIVSERVESMEERLKNDALNELVTYGDKILLHEEELTNHGFDLLPVWEHVGQADICTPAETYSHISSAGFRVSYFRIPITDEQAPIPTVFDILFKLIWNKDDGTDLMFNCQMGRGRTTTGMVISSIIHLVRNSIPVAVPSPVIHSEDSDSQEVFNKRYLSGEYKIILHLVTTLEHGKESKRYADFAVDLCSHIQNLREAIFNFKLRIESADEKAMDASARKSHEDFVEMGINYLVRYFYLIVFAEFVMQRASKKGQTPAEDGEFSAWLGERREILNLVSKPKSIDFS